LSSQLTCVFGGFARIGILEWWNIGNSMMDFQFVL
jgi:hypothetical protein